MLFNACTEYVVGLSRISLAVEAGSLPEKGKSLYEWISQMQRQWRHVKYEPILWDRKARPAPYRPQLRLHFSDEACQPIKMSEIVLIFDGPLDADFCLTISPSHCLKIDQSGVRGHSRMTQVVRGPGER